ncbi:DISARM system phospholipase D-like protein DrmC [Gordonia sp. VNQ95]|uniref:DISARM system phospholipase D-like protein DrmC n=1 Tax=Gordonia sp. VNQ95 TaxID=3156619 RepID=UPI0032B4D433
MTPVAELGALLAPEEASAVAAVLRQRHLPHLAAQRAFPAHRARVKTLLSDLVGATGNPEYAAAMLEGIAAVPRATTPEAVWTAPGVPGLEGRTTLAVADLINQASSTIYAATYTAQPKAEYVQALSNAIARGVSVTVILDRAKQSESGGVVPAALKGARIWTYSPETAGGWMPKQHAKVVVVDRSSALVTSANFSVAAAKLNLECGLLCRDSAVSDGLVRQLETLREHGQLADY